MNDLREKVINELVEHIESALSVDSDYCDCVRTDLLQMVVWLLKAQEPVKPIIKREMDDICSCIDDIAYCGKCGERIGQFKQNYCKNCGRKVAWDG